MKSLANYTGSAVGANLDTMWDEVPRPPRRVFFFNDVAIGGILESRFQDFSPSALFPELQTRFLGSRSMYDLIRKTCLW